MTSIVYYNTMQIQNDVDFLDAIERAGLDTNEPNISSLNQLQLSLDEI
jgi:hypothetical protein